MSKILTVFNQKGGAGKSTVSMHIAGTLGRAGHKVMLIDMDAQGTATRWAAQAPDSQPFPAHIANLASMGGKMHREAKRYAGEYDFLIIDCPPAIESPAPSSAMLISDLAIIPVVPSPADVWASEKVSLLVEAARVTNESLAARLLPNMIQKRTTLANDVIEVLRETGEIPLLENYLSLRQAFRECQLIGATVHALPQARGGEAVAEVDAMVAEILSILN